MGHVEPADGFYESQCDGKGEAMLLKAVMTARNRMGGGSGDTGK